MFIPSTSQAALEELIKTIEAQTPRVGKKVFQDGVILSHIQAMFPDKAVKVVEACRGVDRLREVPIATQPHFMPSGRTLGRQRADQSVYCDTQWERWDTLSFRSMRICVAMKIMPCPCLSRRWTR